MCMETGYHLNNDESKGGNPHHLPYLLHQLPHGHSIGSLLCRTVKYWILPNKKVANTYEEAASQSHASILEIRPSTLRRLHSCLETLKDIRFISPDGCDDKECHAPSWYAFKG